MKKIHLLRHAKSSWEDFSIADIDRPLNKRGIKTCKFMAQHIYDAGCRFEHVFCSPAIRAQSTIELISKSLKGKDIQWKIDDDLYGCNSEDLLYWCMELKESISEVLIIGHNPTFTYFCNELSNSNISNIPTCGYVQLSLLRDCCWQDIAEADFELTTFLKPKELMK